MPLKVHLLCLLEKYLILGLGKEIHIMSLEHFVVPESKEVLKTNPQQTPH